MKLEDPNTFHMHAPVETFDVGPLTVEIRYDETSYGPRFEQDNLSRLICWHRRYNLGDKHGFGSPDDFKDWWTAYGKGGILLPLFLYDHSGITISTQPFSCRWDSGQVGWAYITATKLAEEFPDLPPDQRLQRGEDIIQTEVDEYDSYLRGEVYSVHIIDQEGQTLDICGGHLGRETVKEAAMEVAHQWLPTPPYAVASTEGHLHG